MCYKKTKHAACVTCQRTPAIIFKAICSCSSADCCCMHMRCQNSGALALRACVSSSASSVSHLFRNEEVLRSHTNCLQLERRSNGARLVNAVFHAAACGQTSMKFFVPGASVGVMALLCGQTWLSVHAQMTPLLDPAEVNGESISKLVGMKVSNKL
jgi:hypothetical protein